MPEKDGQKLSNRPWREAFDVSKRSWIIPLVVLLAAAGLLFAIAGHWTEWEGHRAEQRTDDAYLRADMTPLSTRISGTVHKVNVGDYESVKADDAGQGCGSIRGRAGDQSFLS
jgi:multidrug resistance efflux pump